MPPAVRAEFDRAVNSPNPAAIRRFIQDRVDLSRHALWHAGTGPEFVDTWQGNLGNPNLRLAVVLMTRSSSTWRSYIPGSSVKGAIRTALISTLAQARLGNRQADKERFEKDVLGYQDARNDPFRCLRITDAFLPDCATFIDIVRIYNPGRRGNADPGGIKMFYEQCYSMLDGEQIQTRCELAIDDFLAAKECRGRRFIPMQLYADQIIQACKEFYLFKLEQDTGNSMRTTRNLHRQIGPCSR
jgi:hypothetical protein